MTDLADVYKMGKHQFRDALRDSVKEIDQLRESLRDAQVKIKMMEAAPAVTRQEFTVVPADVRNLPPVKVMATWFEVGFQDNALRLYDNGEGPDHQRGNCVAVFPDRCWAMVLRRDVVVTESKGSKS